MSHPYHICASSFALASAPCQQQPPMTAEVAYVPPRCFHFLCVGLGIIEATSDRRGISYVVLCTRDRRGCPYDALCSPQTAEVAWAFLLWQPCLSALAIASDSRGGLCASYAFPWALDKASPMTAEVAYVLFLCEALCSAYDTFPSICYLDRRKGIGGRISNFLPTLFYISVKFLPKILQQQKRWKCVIE